MELESLTPEEFLERLGATEEDFSSMLERGRYRDRFRLEQEHGYWEAKKIFPELPLLFDDCVQAVYDRVEYGRLCIDYLENNYLHPIKFPLVDKKSNLVFEAGEGGHAAVMVNLYNFYNGSNHGQVPGLIGRTRIMSMYGAPGLTGDRIDPTREFIVEGFGYVISTQSYLITKDGRCAFAIGQKLFDTDALDEYDEAIMKHYNKGVAEDFFF